jgi:outer membrane protein assembly factor BamE (lipoprotein component of BamABCDE complex)
MNKFVFRIRENSAVFDIKKTMPVIACLLLFASCSTTSKLPNMLGNTNQTSIFANFDQLGMDKDSFLKKFGTPTNKEIYVDEQNNLIEVLYYTELLNYDMIAVTTKFRFKNGILIDQKKEEIANYVDKKKLQDIYLSR